MHLGLVLDSRRANVIASAQFIINPGTKRLRPVVWCHLYENECVVFVFLYDKQDVPLYRRARKKRATFRHCAGCPSCRLDHLCFVFVCVWVLVCSLFKTITGTYVYSFCPLDRRANHPLVPTVVQTRPRPCMRTQKFALVGAVEAPDAEEIATLSPDVSAASEGGSVKASTSGAASDGRGGKSWRDDRNRLLERLFAWKAGEAWREVVLVCGAAGSKGHPGLRSACELEVRYPTLGWRASPSQHHLTGCYSRIQEVFALSTLYHGG